jgi:hypothetical protein
VLPFVYGNYYVSILSRANSCLSVVFPSIYLLGATTSIALNVLEIETNVNEDDYVDIWSSEHSMPAIVASMQKFLERYVRRKSEADVEENDGVFIVEDAAKRNTRLSTSVGIPTDCTSMSESHILRRSTVSMTKSFHWEGQGIYDFGMD